MVMIGLTGYGIFRGTKPYGKPRHCEDKSDEAASLPDCFWTVGVRELISALAHTQENTI
jgi:hypothetical protein